MNPPTRLAAWKALAPITIVTLGLLVGLATPAVAAPPDFHCAIGATNGIPFCEYTGPVSQLYANANSSLLLLYWDSSVVPLVLDAAGNVGIQGVTRDSAAVVQIADNPDFAQYFSNYALVAQVTGRDVTIQMRAVSALGYLVIDRIWLK
jgi:hypothetical protein